jgi:hypothetical protein
MPAADPPTSEPPEPGLDIGHTAAWGTPLPPAPAPPLGAAAAGTPPLTTAQSGCRESAATAADLQGQFDQRGPVWGGGDLAEPVVIDGGRTVWLFGDTFIGGGPYGGPLETSGFVHNSMVFQFWGSCYDYRFGGTATTGWSSAIPDQPDGSYYWPAGGTFDPATGLLSVLALVVRTTTPNDPWGWTLVGADVIRYRTSDLTIASGERLFTYGDDDEALFGLSVFAQGGRAYLYGCSQTDTGCYLARTDILMRGTSLQYWSGGTWRSDRATATPVDWRDPVGARLYASAVPGGVLATTQVQVTGTKTWGWFGPAAPGPLKPIGRSLWDTSVPPVGPLPGNWFTYQGRTIETSAGTIGMFNVNTSDDEAGRVAGVFGPRFVDISGRADDPVGVVDVVQVSPGTVRVAGWAFDPDSHDPIDVHIYLDSTGHSRRAEVERPDVGAAFGQGSQHGFDVQLPPATDGPSDVCAYAINVALGSNVLLGCRRVVTSLSPVGHLDSVGRRPGGVGFSGWALDPDAWRAVDVHLYVGATGTNGTASVSRPDVGQAFPLYGPDHGFDRVVPAAAGRRSWCAYAIKVGKGATQALGCGAIDVSVDPIGAVDVIERVAGGTRIAGWALDPDVAGPVDVHLYVGSVGTNGAAAVSRPDVAAVFPGYGPNHGFDRVVPVDPTGKVVCAYAINQAAGSNVSLGCRRF